MSPTPSKILILKQKDKAESEAAVAELKSLKSHLKTCEEAYERAKLHYVIIKELKEARKKQMAEIQDKTKKVLAVNQGIETHIKDEMEDLLAIHEELELNIKENEDKIDFMNVAIERTLEKETEEIDTLIVLEEKLREAIGRTEEAIRNLENFEYLHHDTCQATEETS